MSLVVCEPNELVIHPEKVSDVDILVKKLMLPDLANQTPIFIIFGAGTKNSYFRNFSCDRELHRIISWYRLRGWSTKNIIALDIDRDICNEWVKEGITVFCGDWEDQNLINDIKKKITQLRGDYGSKRILYANTYGSNKDVSLYLSWTKILRPQYFLGLYSLRCAFTKQKILNHIKKFDTYKPCDLGILSRISNPGLMGYRGLFLSVLSKVSQTRLTERRK